MKRPMPPGRWDEVMQRDHWTCQRCAQRAESVHHRLPRSRGGTHDLANLVALCGDGTRGCHGWAESNPGEARLAGLTVPGSITRGVYTGPNGEFRALYPDLGAA